MALDEVLRKAQLSKDVDFLRGEVGTLALVAVVQEAYLQGVSTRRVDELV